MAEGANNSSNPQPPINQDGVALPNPSPAPPNSLGTNGSKALDDFFKEIEALKKSVENSNKTLEKQKVLQEKLNQVFFKQEKLNKETLKSQEALRKETDKYKDSEGKWAKGTEAIQAKYEDDLKELSNCVLEAEKEFSAATDALYENTKAIGDERDNRVSSLRTIEEFRKTVEQADSAIGKELETSKDYIEAQKLVIDANEDVSQKTKEIAEESGDASLKGINALNEEVRKQTLEENVKIAKAKLAQTEKEQEYEGAKTEKKEGEDFSADMISKGGFSGLADVKKQIEEIASAEDERFKTYNPDATQEEIKANKEKFIQSSKDALITQIETKQQKELAKIKDARIAQIMKEQGVSKKAAAFLSDTKENRKEDKELLKNQTAQLASLKSIDGNGLLAISKMEDSQVQAQEAAAESAGDTPKWAQDLIDTYKMGSKGLEDLLGGIFKKNDGFFKTILLILTVVIGAVIGYIWYKVQFIFTLVVGILKLLTNLPLGIGKAIAGFMSKIGSIGGIFGKIGEFFKPLKTGITAILKFFPGISSALSQFGKAFSFGFRILGKFFFYIGMAVDVIMGAYKGFKELGNIKGILMGAVAGLVNFFTFGFLDFKTIFNKLQDWFGGIFDALAAVFQPLIDFFVKAYQIVMETFHKIVSIFQGEGSIFGKLWKTISALITMTVKMAINTVVSALKTVFALVITLPMAIGEWIGNLLMSIGSYVIDGVMWFSNWIMSGEWLGDLKNFGNWIYESLVSLLADAITAIADGLGDLPFVGSYIKEALGGGSGDSALIDATKTAGKIVDESKNAVEEIATVSPMNSVGINNDGGLILGGGGASFKSTNVPNYNSNQINNSSNSTSMAKQQANTQTGNVQVNAPTTNVSGGGGGGSPIMLSPTSNRNTEPTYRALLFQNAPAI